MRRADRIGNLFDYLAEHPEGRTKHHIAEHQGFSYTKVCDLVQGLRDVLADTDTISVSCDPDPGDPTGPRLYRLVGTMAEIQAWQGNRIADAERRIRTMLHVVVPIANGADPASMPGRKARLMRKGFTRLIEDLDDIPT